MKTNCRNNLRKLFLMLENSLDKEQETWHPYSNIIPIDEEEEVGPDARDTCVQWLFTLNNYFGLNPETAVLSANILDNFLRVVKARPKYLRCIALTCLFLAAKISEEDETIPSVDHLVIATNYPCSVVDVLRMEKIILNKLNWNLRNVTALDFLYILHAIIMCEYPNLLSVFRHMTEEGQLAMLVRKLLICQESYDVVAFPPSTQALALISLELGLCTRNWFAITVMLQKLIQVENKDLIQCREMMTSAIISTRAEYCFKNFQPECTNKRKVEQLHEDDEDDDIYDSIKRLYGDDSTHDSGKLVSCGQEDAKYHVGAASPVPLSLNVN